MSDIYLVSPDSHSTPMQRVHCKDEIKELQHLLHHNPNLLPGAQISPDDPRRWLLVRREMPVPDRAQGIDRWSIDFLYVDQSGMPTFVECKRYRDTRARREVVGQMLEYAANGPRYWSAATLLGYATQAAGEQGKTIEQALQDLKPDEEEAPDVFFERLLANMREGVLRLIFFMEEAPPELASIVEFLNNQMERSEVLLVEVRQFTNRQVRIAVPTLVGYTEQGRQVKEVVSVTPSGKHRRWNEADFFEDAAKRLEPTGLGQVQALYDFAQGGLYTVKWGKGPARGTFRLHLPTVHHNCLAHIYSDGNLAVNFGWYKGNVDAERVRDQFKQLLVTRLGLPIVDEYQALCPEFAIDIWGPRVSDLIEVLQELAPGAPHD